MAADHVLHVAVQRRGGERGGGEGWSHPLHDSTVVTVVRKIE